MIDFAANLCRNFTKLLIVGPLFFWAFLPKCSLILIITLIWVKNVDGSMVQELETFPTLPCNLKFYFWPYTVFTNLHLNVKSPFLTCQFLNLNFFFWIYKSSQSVCVGNFDESIDIELNRNNKCIQCTLPWFQVNSMLITICLVDTFQNRAIIH